MHIYCVYGYVKMRAILIMILISLGGVLFPLYADTNGIWTYPQDIKPGVFGEDESTNYSESYTFNHKIIGSYYYDIKDPNYVLNLSGVSNMYRIVADLYFSSGNTAYYINPAGTSKLNILDAQQLQLRGTDIENIFATKDEVSDLDESTPKLSCKTVSAGGRYAYCPSGYLVTGCSAGHNKGSISHYDSYCKTHDSVDWTLARCCKVS